MAGAVDADTAASRGDAKIGDLMVIEAARRLAGRRSVLVGIGEPCTAALLAKRHHAPDLSLLFEAGVVDAVPDRVPLSIGDACLVKGAAGVTSMYELFAYYLAAGRVEVGFMGAAQVDRQGRVNTTVIGPYASPTVRLPGSGGACDIAIGVDVVMIMTRQERRRFPSAVDFTTSPAALGGGKTQTVITDLCVMEPRGGELAVTHLQPGVSPERVREATGWDIEFADDCSELGPPAPEEIASLRALEEEMSGG